MINKVNDPKGAAGNKKVPLGLIPPFAMEQTAWVHKLGAEKYSDRTAIGSCPPAQLVSRYCSCGRSTEPPYATLTDQKSARLPAMRDGLLGPTDCASHATIGNYEPVTPPMPSDSRRLQWAGSGTTMSTSVRKLVNVMQDLLTENGLGTVIVVPNSPDMGCPSKMKSDFSASKGACVESAKGHLGSGDLTLITATPQGSSEDFSVTGAIKDSGYLETLHQLLGQHLPTCESRKIYVDGADVVFPGSFNWRRAPVCASTYVHAILRHLNAWRDGEDLDPESGKSHIAHVACCCNILMDAEHVGTLDDDRVKVKKPTVAVVNPDWRDGYFPTMPANLLPLPDGFVFVGEGPLNLSSRKATRDIIMFYGGKWQMDQIWSGSSTGVPYAVQLGSPTCDELIRLRLAENGVSPPTPPASVDPLPKMPSDLRSLRDGWVYIGKGPFQLSENGLVPWIARYATHSRWDYSSWAGGLEGVHYAINSKSAEGREALRALRILAAEPDQNDDALMTCSCGRRKVYHWHYGWCCEDCNL